MSLKFSATALIFAVATAAPDAALAYIGPGAGLSAIGTLVALVGAVLLAIVGFVWYPVKRMLKGLRGTASGNHPGSARDSDPAAAPAGK